MAIEKLQNARNADPIAVLPPTHPTDRFASITQFIGLVVAVEGQRNCATGAPLPHFRSKAASCPHLVDELAPLCFRPLPWFLRRPFRHLVTSLTLKRSTRP